MYVMRSPDQLRESPTVCPVEHVLAWASQDRFRNVHVWETQSAPMSFRPGTKPAAFPPPPPPLQICAIFVVAFGILVFVLTSHVTDAAGVASWDWSAGGLTAVSFVVGAGDAPPSSLLLVGARIERRGVNQVNPHLAFDVLFGRSQAPRSSRDTSA